MFIKATKYTLNTDSIIYAEEFANGKITLYLTDGKQIELNDEDAAALWSMVQRKTMPHIWKKENEHLES